MGRSCARQPTLNEASFRNILKLLVAVGLLMRNEPSQALQCWLLSLIENIAEGFLRYFSSNFVFFLSKALRCTFEYLIILNIKSWKKNRFNPWNCYSWRFLTPKAEPSIIFSNVTQPHRPRKRSHQNLITSLLILLWLVFGKARISRESFPFPNVIDARLRFLISNSDIFPSNLDSTLLRCGIFRYALKCRNEFISKTKVCKLEWHSFETEFHRISFRSSEPECAKMLKEKLYQMGKSVFFGDFNPAPIDYMLQTSRTHAHRWLDVPWLYEKIWTFGLWNYLWIS